MIMTDSVLEEIERHEVVIHALKSEAGSIAQSATLILEAVERGNKVIWIGNGGSAAESQHLSAELVGRFRINRRPIASIALTTDTSVLTAIGNDFGYEDVFARQVEALAQKGDVVIAISTSGKSPNIVRAMGTANRLGCYCIALMGSNGVLASLCRVAIRVPSDETSRIQEAHTLIGHIICAQVEAGLFS